jgi:hypothetical protein
MGQPIADEKPYATFVFNHEGEEYVLRSDYERLRALVPDSRDTLRAQWNAMHGVGLWIPVSERLPSKDGSVLVAWDTREPVGIGYFSDGEWVDPHFAISEYGRPTHWMPLPEPPTN